MLPVQYLTCRLAHRAAAPSHPKPLAGEGLVLRPGQYDQPILLTSLQAFNTFALKVQVGPTVQQCSCWRPHAYHHARTPTLLQGGVVGADIQLGSMYFNWDGLVFDATTGSSNVIANVTVSHWSVAQASGMAGTLSGVVSATRCSGCCRCFPAYG